MLIAYDLPITKLWLATRTPYPSFRTAISKRPMDAFARRTKVEGRPLLSLIRAPSHNSRTKDNGAGLRQPEATRRVG
jgi:hypothetical protein